MHGVSHKPNSVGTASSPNGALTSFLHVKLGLMDERNAPNPIDATGSAVKTDFTTQLLLSHFLQFILILRIVSTVVLPEIHSNPPRPNESKILMIYAARVIENRQIERDKVDNSSPQFQLNKSSLKDSREASNAFMVCNVYTSCDTTNVRDVWFAKTCEVIHNVLTSICCNKISPIASRAVFEVKFDLL